jgi:hypothetical protein
VQNVKCHELNYIFIAFKEQFQTGSDRKQEAVVKSSAAQHFFTY